jgi:hypothetical protein
MLWLSSCFSLLGCGLVGSESLKLTGKAHGQIAQTRGLITVPKPATAPARAQRETATGKLAKFFPNATPVRIPVRLTRVEHQNGNSSESTVIEYGTPQEVLFASTLPLEFADLLRVQNSDGTLDVQACVVAVQYNSGRTAVAARFTGQVPDWIVKS